MNASGIKELTYGERIEMLRETKLRHTREKRQAVGALDMDDLPIMLPPADRMKIVSVIGGSGNEIRDALLSTFTPESNHPSGGFFGARACGRNFRALMDVHPVYVDPASSLAGGYMASFISYRDPAWNPDFDYSSLHEEQKRYQLHHGIGSVQHFCQDMRIGFELGWSGLLAKIRRYRGVQLDAEAQELYAGLEQCVLGIQGWIGRHAYEAGEMAKRELNPTLRRNLRELAEINARLATEPPATFREACQWTLWFQMAAKVYNTSGALGRVDQFLYPFFIRDKKKGILTDEEAVFHLCCYFVMDTSYTQLGGPDAAGRDATNPLSYLVLEAAHGLKIPVNVGVCVGDSTDPGLLRRGVEIMFEDRAGMPKFLGVDRTCEGFMRNGYSAELARERAYSGCHWSALPGREFTMNDCIKINLPAVFNAAMQDATADPAAEPSVAGLWELFEKHLRRSVEVTAEGIDFHLSHMYEVFPELILDLLCHGPVERGRDASHGGVEYYNLCVDCAGLATVADSFAAVEQRVEKERNIPWGRLKALLDSDWAGPDGERARLMMRSVPRFGSGGSPADAFGARIARAFTRFVTEKPTPRGFRMLPGIFSWAAHVAMGKGVGATPNGRRAGAPISHGPNPDPGFRRDAAPTALAAAVASVQPGYGNTAPMQIELDPGLSRSAEDVEKVAALIRTHFKLGGTQINMNIVDKKTILEASRDPGLHPDLVVRVTGFSAFFASLSPEMRQIVVDRILSES